MENKYRLTVMVLAVMLAGCADMSGITSQAELRSADSVGLSIGGAVDPVGAQWWRDFGDARLDSLVDQALANNPNLKVVRARMVRAEAVTEVASSAFGPQINGSLDLTRQRYTANGAVPPPLAGAMRDSGTAQLSTSWELDFFGKNRSALESALGVARAAQADTAAARSLLASNVVKAWFQIARLNEQALVARRALAQREQAMALVRDRVNAGLDTLLELRQSEGALPEARQQLEALAEQSTLAHNALAALIGQPTTSPPMEEPSLSSFKSSRTPTALPADLLGRRPDIAAARWRAQAAGEDVRNAKAQFFPNVNLTAFAGLSSIGLGRLIDAGSQQWGVGPAVRLPIFEGGRLRANLRGKTADLDAAIESYNAAVIDAVREVADLVASSQSVTRQQTEQRQAQAATESAYDIAVQRYRAGLGTLLNVLSAESAVLAQRRLAVDLAARALDTQVGLFRALGGGWQTDTVTAAHQKDSKGISP